MCRYVAHSQSKDHPSDTGVLWASASWHRSSDYLHSVIHTLQRNGGPRMSLSDTLHTHTYTHTAHTQIYRFQILRLPYYLFFTQISIYDNVACVWHFLTDMHLSCLQCTDVGRLDNPISMDFIWFVRFRFGSIIQWQSRDSKFKWWKWNAKKDEKRREEEEQWHDEHKLCIICEATILAEENAEPLLSLPLCVNAPILIYCWAQTRRFYTIFVIFNLLAVHWWDFR